MVRFWRFECRAERALKALETLAHESTAPQWERIERRWLDTPTDQLAEAGLELIADVADERREFALTDKRGQVIQVVKPGRGMPRAIEDIGDPRLARSLCGTVLKAALAVRAREELSRCRVDCRDPDGKSLGTVSFERRTRNDADPIAVRAVPRRGYADEFHEVLRTRLQPLFDERASTGTPAPDLASPPQVLAWQLRNCRQVLASHLPGVIDGRDIEALHEYRVAMRRARSYISGFRAYVEPERAVVRDLAWLGRLSGPVRDLDVWSQALAAADDAPTFVVERVLRDHERYRGRLLAAFESARYRRFEHDFDAWLSQLAGNEETIADDDFLGTLVLRHFEHLRRSIITGGERMPYDDLHSLRKQAKKLRYLTEAAIEMRGPAEAAVLVRPVKKLQDAAGEICDRYAHADFVQRWLKEEKRGDRKARNQLSSLLRRLTPPGSIKLRKPAARTLRTRLRKIASPKTRRAWVTAFADGRR